MQTIAYAVLKLSLRFCRWVGFTSLKAIALDAIGDVSKKEN